ncbi:flavodoxin domain-containing protein [Neobacillus rhizophilus]|uniref:Flavodoxin domain-containing protein n=1 Tax=Neobacillus rhizophilus TaxID=2833579 RepID=A0A942YRZ5_9BACI|nr:flavodoxin domain-containing protein [Neobacillus rhizophilus]MBS4211348.1 flavodoxin domain-containing protein [Neobacillus rhizophilus]MBU8916766.1 flavodoxin domain-containing protein [Bacillus sp. FJAT-29953]
MKTLIVYCSSHGTTEKAVSVLCVNIEGEVLAVDLKRDKILFDLDDYDGVIIGGSIHAGEIQRKIKQFIKQHHDELLEKVVGLFLCCIRDGDIAVEQFNHAFPQDLRKNSVAMGLFGGEFIVSKMNFFERQVVKKVDSVIKDESHLNLNAIMEFALRYNNIRTPV